MSHFNQEANQWDTQDKIDLAKKTATHILKYLPTKSKLDVLDFGCGTGLLGFSLDPILNSLIGVDPSVGMIEEFSKKTKNHSNAIGVMGNEDVLKPSMQFDLIVSAMAFHHIGDPMKVLRKLTQHLRPHGTIALVDLEPEDGTFHKNNSEMGVKHLGFDPQTIASWAEQIDGKLTLSRNHTFEKNSKKYHQFLAIIQF